MEKLNLIFDARSDSPDLKLTVKFNQQVLEEISLKNEFTSFEYELETADLNQALEFVMSGKTQQHTSIDELGNIVADSVVEIKNILIDGIDVSQLFIEKSKYTHNHNGNTELIEDRFFGTMGCNGSVRFEFTDPFYIWLLENM